jgi:hypothetical protein
VRRWVARVGRTRTAAFVQLTRALGLARKEAQGDAALAARLDEFVAVAGEIAFRDPIELADLAVDGEDLRALGVPAGPRMGRLLRTLLDRVIADPALNTRDRLLELAGSLRADP